MTTRKGVRSTPQSEKQIDQSIPIESVKINQTEVAKELATKVQQAGYSCRVAGQSRKINPLGGLHAESRTVEPKQAAPTPKQPTRPKPEPRHKCLIVHRGDGFIEIYGQSTLDCRLVNLPTTSTIEQELAVEQLMESALPRAYRDIFWPASNCRLIGRVVNRSIQDLRDIVAMLDAVESPRFTSPNARILAAMGGAR